jgi:hypothetical protein
LSRAFSNAAIILLLIAVAIPLVLLSLPFDQSRTGNAAFAPCHQQAPMSGTPSMPNHDCCIVGHDHALPGLVSGTPAIAFVVLGQLAAVSPTAPFGPHREPALTSFDPPLADLPLRI